MKVFLLIILLSFLPVLKVSALEIEAPEAPAEVLELMPEEGDSFGQKLLELLQKGLNSIKPDLRDAASLCVKLIATVLILSVFQSFSGNMQTLSSFTAAAAIGGLLLQNTQTMIGLAVETIRKIVDYGKLFLPVMTAAMATQGGVASSAAIYTGSAFFISVLSGVLRNLFVPLLYLYLALSVGNAATGEGFLKKLAELLKGGMVWGLKTLVMVFTSYLSITGIVSGTTDAATLKAAKVTISTVVPVVGGILSDASEAVLVSAGLLKNAAGIYGILAITAILLVPFLKIASHYLLLKITSAFCCLIGTKQTTELVTDFASVMGLLLAMTGVSCIMHLFTAICFLKGVG